MERTTGESYNFGVTDFFVVDKTKTLLYNVMFNWEPYALKNIIYLILAYLSTPDEDVDFGQLNPTSMTKDDIEMFIRSMMTTRTMPRFYSVEVEDAFGEIRKEYISYEEHLENLYNKLNTVYEKSTSRKETPDEVNAAYLKDCRLAIIFGLCMDDRVKRLFFSINGLHDTFCIPPSSPIFQKDGMNFINQCFEELKRHGDEFAFVEQCMKIIKSFEN